MKLFGEQKTTYALLVTVGFLSVGTVGYSVIENYSVLDALYMTVITISTVGFGEVHTLSGPGRFFTIFLILFGLGSIAFLAHTFTEAIIERASSKTLGRKTMLKKVQQLTGHYIICGFGRVGIAAADQLKKVGVDFVVIESNEEKIKIIGELGYNHIEGDATREESLLEAGIKKANGVMALLDEDPDNLFVVLTARELNPTLSIIARTEVASSESRMLRAGADSTISLYATAGKRVAEKILKKHSGFGEKKTETRKPTKQTEWIGVTEGSGFAGKTVETVASSLSASIIGIRRGGEDILMPQMTAVLQDGDEVLVSGAQVEGAHEVAEGLSVRKIVLIDDNPVIRRLYTRLFQKAGFSIVTAETGAEGLSLVMQTRPDGVVIDFHLPDMNGLQVSAEIRKNSEYDHIKLFMFTGDEEDETRRKALEIGVDSVIVKSPDAVEIINAVKKGLAE